MSRERPTALQLVRPTRRKSIVKKLSLILVSLIAAVPSGYLVYLLVSALTLKHIWDKKFLAWFILLAAGLIAGLTAWYLVWIIGWYSDKAEASSDEEAGEAGEPLAAEEAEEAATVDEADEVEAAEADEAVGDEDFESSDAMEAHDADDFEPAEAGSEFDLPDDDVVQTDTDDFQLDAADDFEEIEDLEEEEEAPKKKKKKK